MNHAEILTKNPANWMVSDDLQFLKQLTETCYDIIQIIIWPGERFSATHITLNFSDYSLEELDRYSVILGYKNYADFKATFMDGDNDISVEHILSEIAEISADKLPQEKFDDIEDLHNWLSAIDKNLMFDGSYVGTNS